MKGLFNQQTLEQLKLAQSVKVASERFTAMHLEGRPMTRPMILKYANSLFGEMKIT